MDKDVCIQFKDQKNPMQPNYHRAEESPNSAEYDICIYILKKICFMNSSTKKSYCLKKSKSQLNTMFY